MQLFVPEFDLFMTSFVDGAIVSQ